MKTMLVLLLLVLTACGVRPTDTIRGGPAPTEEVTDEVVVYLLTGTTLTRVVRPPVQPPTTPMDLLAQGPTTEELAEGLTTEIPPYAAPITVVRSPDGVTVRISSTLKYLSPVAQAQLVCTASPQDRRGAAEVTLSDPTVTLPPQTCPFEA